MKAVAVLPLLVGCSLFHASEGDRCQEGRIVMLGSQDDVLQIAGCREVSGLVVRTGASIDLAPLRELEEIHGDQIGRAHV